MAIALDKKVTNLVLKNGTAGTTIDITFPSLPAVGSLIVVPIAVGNFGASGLNTFSSVVDNQGNGTYSNLQVAAHASGNAEVHLAYVIAANSSGTFTVTVNLTTGGSNVYASAGAASFTGVQAVIDKSNTIAQSSTSTGVNISTAATTAAPELAISLVSCSQNTSNNHLVQNDVGFTNLYTEQDGSTNMPMLCDYQIELFSGVNMPCNVSHDTGYDAGLVAAFLPAASDELDADSGVYVITGTAAILRPGAFTYLRYRK